MAKTYTPYGSLLEHHLRIGDTEFYVPPTAISVHRQMQNKRAKVLRARNSLPKESGYFNKIIELTIFFPDKQSINEELRPLLAQLKKCPFLPIENSYLNDVHKISAVTIAGLTVQTTPGFPNTLEAQIQCYAFEPLAYIADDEDRTFDQMFDWELFRWYYQRNLDPSNEGMFNTYYEPLYSDLDSSYKFRIAAEDDLETMAAWRKEKTNLIKDYVNAKEENFYGKEKLEEEFDANLNDMYDKAKYEYNIHYEDYDIPGLILTNFSVGFENTITSQQLQADAMPTHQYMGSQDTVIVARFKTNNEDSVASLEALLHRATYMIRNYHKEASNGFLAFDHQLARLFGVNNVTIDDVQTSTIAGQPGCYDITLTMTSYNRIERKLNEVKWMSETATWDIDKYEDQGFWSLLTMLDPANMIPDLGSEDYEAQDWVQLNPLVRFGRYFWDRPIAEKLTGSLKLFFSGHDRKAASLDQEDIKNIIYDEAIKQFFVAAEVYPDLELPTYGECIAAGFDVEDTNGGIFVEPDFFIKYKKGILMQEMLLDAMNKNHNSVLRDSSGGEVTLNGDKVTSVNEATQNEMNKSKEEFQAAHEESQVKYADVKEELVDTDNLSESEMEALIREKAEAAGLNQNLPLAFVQAMDPQMKHFYDKGTNAKQGKVVNSNPSSPVMMNKDFKYYTNSDGSIDGEYIGVMKVRKMYGSSVNMLGKNIEYNIESGVKKMAQLHAELERIHANSASGSEKIYKEQNVYDLFGLENGRGSLDSEKARFAGVIMLYLGFQKEYMDLIKDNKKPSTKLVNMVNQVLAAVEDKEEWTNTEIQNKVKDLPIKDFKTAGNTSTSSVAPTGMTTEDFADDEKLHHGMLHDMIRYDKRGRLIRAFPTFFLTFIDEGQFIGTVKLSDQYFQYQAVMDIMYTNSRKEASSTLVLEMSNVYGSLDDAEKGMDLTNTSYSEVFKTMTMPGAVAREAERSRHRNPNYYKSIMLRTGTRIHFRMGYGSNAMEMPTIMNGTITSIQNNGESITVIAQDDGIELTNKIRADVNETTDGGFLFSKKEPTEIVDELLTDSQGFFKNLWAGLSNKEFENHSLGIMHFGSQGAPQGWDSLGSIFGGIAVGAGIGALTGGPLGALAGGFTRGMFSALVVGRESRTIREINMNVYQTTGLTNEEQDSWWNKTKDAFGIGQADEDGINIGLFDKSVWDVMNICASMGDDHIVAVHPFGFRNTVFSGKTYFPLHYDYVVEGETLAGTAVKPFRQYHGYDSQTSIISNTIETTEENMKTVAVGVYMNEGEMDTTAPLYVDTNIWPEKQRVVNIDTTMNAQGVRLVEAIPLVGGLLNKPFKWYYDEGVAIKITARGLSDYVRDMYDGYLTVMGDPSVKPYDQMLISDTYNDIHGTADVKEVTQIMNHDVGYITLIKPDAVVVNSDRRSMGFLLGMQGIVGSVLITMGLRKILSTSAYSGNLPILNSMWASTVNSLSTMKSVFDIGKASGKFYDTLTGKSISASKVKNAIERRTGTGASPKDIARWTKNGLLAKLQSQADGEIKDYLPDLLSGDKGVSKKWFSNIKLKAKAFKLLSPKTFKAAWAAVHVGTGPIGWLALAIETAVVHIISSTVGEFIDRWLFMRQACLVAPLSKGGREFSAGLNGHKGSVVGDSPDLMQSIFTNEFSALLLGFIGVDARQYSQDAREGEMMSSKSLSAESIDTYSLVRDFIENSRTSIATNNISKLYEADRKAALQQINARLELLEKRDTKAVHDEEETTFEEKKERISGWFSSLWDSVSDFFSNEESEETESGEEDASSDELEEFSIKGESTPSDTSYDKGVKKYKINSDEGLVDLAKTKGPWGISIVGGSLFVRQGTANALKKALEAYGKKVNVTSGWRKGDTYWHGTGWAVDLDTPNTMSMTNGKLRYTNGVDKNNARKLVECCIQAGFDKLYFGDWDIVQEMNKKYGAGKMVYDPSGHWNHLHLSYPN